MIVNSEIKTGKNNSFADKGYAAQIVTECPESDRLADNTNPPLVYKADNGRVI